MPLSLFDCNCMIGKRADRKEPEPWSLEMLSRDMDHSGIAEALVTHAMSRDYDPSAGNQGAGASPFRTSKLTWMLGHSSAGERRIATP